jgi:glycosyltransferase involved in cell wall biosynthesis
VGAAIVDVGVLTVAHDVADARLHRIVGALCRRGLSVEVQGLGEPADGPADAVVNTVARSGLVVRAVRSMTLPWKSRARVLFTLDPDVVPMARLVGRLRHRQVVVDVHEDYPKVVADRTWSKGRLRHVVGWLVRLATESTRGADLTVVADEHVPPATARRRLVVRNIPTATTSPLVPPRRDPVPRAVYIGDLRESRGLFDMLEAIARAPGWQLDLVGPIAAADSPLLSKRLAAPDLAGRVRCHGRQPPERAQRIAQGAWVGLCLLHDTPAFREAIPTKLYEYLASGLAVIVSDLPRQAEIVVESGAGVVVANAEDTAATMRAWSEAPATLDTHRGAAIVWASTKLPVEDPFDTLAGIVADLLGPRAQSSSAFR